MCHTNAGKPAQFLIKGICYPEALSYKSRATVWGCQHEQKAQNFYFESCSKQHENFSVEGSGLVVNYKWPFIGASPDGIINCSCHGKGVLEIKCPFCHWESTIQSAAMDKKKFVWKNQMISQVKTKSMCIITKFKLSCLSVM